MLLIPDMLGWIIGACSLFLETKRKLLLLFLNLLDKFAVFIKFIHINTAVLRMNIVVCTFIIWEQLFFLDIGIVRHFLLNLVFVFFEVFNVFMNIWLLKHIILVFVYFLFVFFTLTHFIIKFLTEVLAVNRLLNFLFF
jgi:hypothetical protein